jgi:ribonucleoside-diphosphate reductase alpha chain
VSTKSESSKESAATPATTTASLPAAPAADASAVTKAHAPWTPAESAHAPAPAAAPAHAVQPRRERLPHTRRSLTHKFDIQGHEGYINVGFYPDGRPGELFITMAKEGSTIGGLMDVLGTAISIGLQYGVPLEVFVNKFAHSRFEPAGFTKNPDIPIAKSIADYIFRWLGMEFIPGYREANAPKRPTPEPEPTPVMPVLKVNGHRTATIADLEHAEAVMETTSHLPEPSEPHLSTGALSVDEGLGEQDRQFAHFQSDAPPCDNCGALTVRCGTCYRCFNCGNSMGCS